MEQRRLQKQHHQPCPHCGKRLQNLKNQKRHERMHTSKVTFQCNICKKNYLHKSSLSAHLNVHLNVFACSICKTAFPKERDLIAHNSRRHSNNLINKVAKFSCKDCDKTFDTLIFYKNHMRQVHSFGIEFGPQLPLENTHTTLCGADNNKSMDKQLCAKRNAGLKKRRHVCPICQTAFFKLCKLVSHSTTHLDNPPIDCKLCHARFRSHQALTFHKYQVHGKDLGSLYMLKDIGFKDKKICTESSVETEDQHHQSKSSIYVRQCLKEDPNLWPKVVLSRDLNDLLLLQK